MVKSFMIQYVIGLIFLIIYNVPNVVNVKEYCMSNKIINGEKEAIELLEKIGLRFDHDYSDQFRDSMAN